MYGRISKDLNREARDTPNMAPQSGFLVDPVFRKQNYLLPVMGTAKLNGLYNTANMPVLYERAGQVSAGNRRQTGVRNDGLSKILFPNRMPYSVTPPLDDKLK